MLAGLTRGGGAAVRRAGARYFSFEKHAIPSWATVDPWEMSGSSPATGMNLLQGEWVSTAQSAAAPPLPGQGHTRMPGPLPAHLPRRPLRQDLLVGSRLVCT